MIKKLCYYYNLFMQWLFKSHISNYSVNESASTDSDFYSIDSDSYDTDYDTDSLNNDFLGDAFLDADVEYDSKAFWATFADSNENEDEDSVSWNSFFENYEPLSSSESEDDLVEDNIKITWFEWFCDWLEHIFWFIM